jgi:hypothetical protein
MTRSHHIPEAASSDDKAFEPVGKQNCIDPGLGGEVSFLSLEHDSAPSNDQRHLRDSAVQYPVQVVTAPGTRGTLFALAAR